VNINSVLKLILVAATITSASRAQDIILRVIDSKSGAVVQGEGGYGPAGMWLFDAAGKQIPVKVTPDMLHTYSEHHDAQGAASVEIWANGYDDCRKGKVQPGTSPKYLVSDILSRGIVTQNRCTKKTVAAVPGVIVLFTRPPNWLERFVGRLFYE
jgi:hypothetical protein